MLHVTVAWILNDTVILLSSKWHAKYWSVVMIAIYLVDINCLWNKQTNKIIKYLKDLNLILKKIECTARSFSYCVAGRKSLKIHVTHHGFIIIIFFMFGNSVYDIKTIGSWGMGEGGGGCVTYIIFNN